MGLRHVLIGSIGAVFIAGAVQCSGSSGPEAAVLSPAPRECPFGVVRADSVSTSELVEQMRGHVPTGLPSGFGLVGAWAEGDGAQGTAIWADGMCREVLITFWPMDASSSDGPKVGDWTVTEDVPGGCLNSVLGEARCLGYRVNVEGGTLRVQMMGIERSEGDEIVLSIPT